MNVTSIVNVQPNLYQLQLFVGGEELEIAAQKMYEQTKGNFLIAGYAKGEAPREAIEEKSGDIFSCDGLNALLAEQSFALVTASCKEIGVVPLGIPVPELGEKNEKGCFVTLTVATMPSVTVGEYCGLVVECEPVTLSEPMVEKELQKLRSRFVDYQPKQGPAALGDCVVIDFCGKVDGVAFEGGAAERFELTIGSKQFIPGFEEQLIGHTANETFDIKVKFPSDYPVKALSAQETVFTITLHQVSSAVLPELTDEFVQKVTKFQTLQQLHGTIKDDLYARLEKRNGQTAESQLLMRITKQATIDAIPQSLVEDEYQANMEMLQAYLRVQNIKLQDYLLQIGVTKEQFETQSYNNATQAVRGKLVFLAIAQREAFAVSQEEIQACVQKMAQKQQYTTEAYQKQIPAYTTEWQLLVQKAIQFVLAQSVVKVKKI